VLYATYRVACAVRGGDQEEPMSSAANPSVAGIREARAGRARRT
jgi:hypothetical protein